MKKNPDKVKPKSSFFGVLMAKDMADDVHDDIEGTKKVGMRSAIDGDGNEESD